MGIIYHRKGSYLTSSKYITLTQTTIGELAKLQKHSSKLILSTLAFATVVFTVDFCPNGVGSSHPTSLIGSSSSSNGVVSIVNFCSNRVGSSHPSRARRSSSSDRGQEFIVVEVSIYCIYIEVCFLKKSLILSLYHFSYSCFLGIIQR